MKFFSKITVICNLCFLAAVVCWFIDVKQKQHGVSDRVIPLPWLESTLVILGYGAIIINAFFLLVCFIFTAFKMELQVPKWIIIFNLVLFGCQVFFHFFYK